MGKLGFSGKGRGGLEDPHLGSAEAWGHIRKAQNVQKSLRKEGTLK